MTTTMTAINVYQRWLEEEAASVRHLYRDLANVHKGGDIATKLALSPVLSHLSRATSALEMASGEWPEDLS